MVQTQKMDNWDLFFIPWLTRNVSKEAKKCKRTGLYNERRRGNMLTNDHRAILNDVFLNKKLFPPIYNKMFLKKCIK